MPPLRARGSNRPSITRIHLAALYRPGTRAPLGICSTLCLVSGCAALRKLPEAPSRCQRGMGRRFAPLAFPALRLRAGSTVATNEGLSDPIAPRPQPNHHSAQPHGGHGAARRGSAQGRAERLALLRWRREHRSPRPPGARYLRRCSSSRGMISTKLQGRCRLSSCHLRMPVQASTQAPGEPGSAKM
jgi:hypothetical protein